MPTGHVGKCYPVRTHEARAIHHVVGRADVVRRLAFPERVQSDLKPPESVCSFVCLVAYL